MDLKKAREFIEHKKELSENNLKQIAPLISGMNYSQVYIVLDAVKEKISESIRFLPSYQETPQTKR